MENGGTTLNPNTRATAEHTNGYYVSLEGHEKRLPVSEDEYIFAAYLDRHIDRARHYNATNTGPIAYVGLWVDGNEIVFDLSLHIAIEIDAVVMGWENNQKAIFDIAKNQAINLL